MDKVLVYINGIPELIEYANFSNNVYKTLHRPSEEGPAVCHPDGSEEYYENGVLHRLDGPALIDSKSGYQEYWVNGQKHRLDGPAIVNSSDEEGVDEYWVNGTRISEKKWKNLYGK